jgi:hypothetical protein
MLDKDGNRTIYKTVKFSNIIDDITVQSRRKQNHAEVMKTSGQREQRTFEYARMTILWLD